VDKNRRQFLKIALIGSGTFIAGKILGPLLSKSPNVSNTVSPRDNSSAFNVVENGQFLSVYDSSGEEVLQIDKSG
jgi:hypothetical protein